jgi:transcriptional regulator with XRE-family HTH domain
MNGSRIREERKKLGLTQARAAELCAVKFQQWNRYENDKSVLDGSALRAFGAIGADVGYILSGIQTIGLETQSVQETSLLECYKMLSYEKQSILLRIATRMANIVPSDGKITVELDYNELLLVDDFRTSTPQVQNAVKTLLNSLSKE